MAFKNTFFDACELELFLFNYNLMKSFMSVALLLYLKLEAEFCFVFGAFISL